MTQEFRFPRWRAHTIAAVVLAIELFQVLRPAPPKVSKPPVKNRVVMIDISKALRAALKPAARADQPRTTAQGRTLSGRLMKAAQPAPEKSSGPGSCYRIEVDLNADWASWAQTRGIEFAALGSTPRAGTRAVLFNWPPDSMRIGVIPEGRVITQLPGGNPVLRGIAESAAAALGTASAGVGVYALYRPAQAAALREGVDLALRRARERIELVSAVTVRWRTASAGLREIELAKVER